MPLVKIEQLSENCQWGLWEIDESLQQLSHLFSFPDELAKINTIRVEQKKKEKIAARLVLKELFQRFNEPYTGVSSDQTGKPSLTSCPYFVSLSHSYGLAAAIINKTEKTGIDIELIQEKIRYIAARVLNPEEIRLAADKVEILTLLWSMKEVLYKVNGEKGIDFKAQLFISPFDYQPKGGMAEGIIKTNEMVETFNIKYFRHNDYVVAYKI